MARSTPLWQQNSSYTAALDRLLMTALWPLGGALGALPTVVANTMNVSIPAGFAAVPMGAQGVELCRWDAAEVVTVAASPPSGQSRIDLIICQVRDAAVDAGANNDFIFSVVTGAPAASNPVQPNAPANSVAICSVPVAGAAANLNGAVITPIAPPALTVPSQAVAYDLNTDVALTSTVATTLLQGNFTPSRSTVKVELVSTGFCAVAMSRVYFRANVGALVSRLSAPMSAVTPAAFYAGGAAIFNGFTPGNVSTFSIQAWVDSGNTYRCRPVSQPTLENMRMIISDA